jgi:succinate-semialdehyde dehydrogenase / glutarate-semialdehyde dehydrogenase
MRFDTAPKQLLIDGRWHDAEGARTFAIQDPSTGTELCAVADATPEDAGSALDAAVAAFDSYRDSPPRARSSILSRAERLMQERTEQLATLISSEMGKPLEEARDEVAYARGFLRWYAEEAVRINGRSTVPEAGSGRILTIPQAVGPCLFITPWNFPLAMGARKIAPALAAGCTCVIKPAPQTPLSMLAFGEILVEAGVPSGAVNIVPTSSGSEAMGPLIADPRLRKLSFTGSTAVGMRLLAQSAEQVLKVSMELGGNAPFIVFADADLDAAIEGALIAKMRNGGEACTSANRFLIEETIKEEFAERLALRMRSLKVGPGLDPGVKVGPLIDSTQLDKVAVLVDDAIGKGARALCGGRKMQGPGHFYPPTVLDAVPEGADLLAEEVFGPVAPIVSFATEGEAIAKANATQYGLVAYVYTRDLQRSLRLAERLECGMVGLNQGAVSNVGAPFGGVKHSGIGREGGPEGLAEYLETKYVAIAA